MAKNKRALVLNNFKFDNQKDDLNSGAQDSLTIVRALENIDFQVELKENKTAEEMEQLMKEFAKKDFTDSDCSPVCHHFTR
jgi:hypothetical protein